MQAQMIWRNRKP